MTRDEILSMKPGRELDALVAEKLMGWRKKTFPGGGGGFTAWVDENERVMKLISNSTMSETCYRCDYFRPSTDIAAAWEVLEKIGGFTLVPAGRNIHGKISFWYAGKKYIDGNKVYEVNDVGNPTTGCGETAPEAICKAALLAVMGK